MSGQAHKIHGPIDTSVIIYFDIIYTINRTEG